MAIKRLTVMSFRTFEKPDLELGNPNILIGANASGKSNLLQEGNICIQSFQF